MEIKRIPWNKGMHPTEEHIEKIRQRAKERFKGQAIPWLKHQIPWDKGKSVFQGEENPFYGKKHTEKSKEKMSLSKKGRIPWNKDLTAEIDNRITARTHSEETKRKISQANKISYEKWKGKTLEERFGKNKAIEIKERMKQNKLYKHHSEETKQKIGMKNKGNKAVHICWSRILKEAKELEKNGFRVIPIGKVVPDIIAIKDGKIFAIEVEYQKPKYEKYSADIKKFYDDIIWIIKK